MSEQLASLAHSKHTTLAASVYDPTDRQPCRLLGYFPEQIFTRTHDVGVFASLPQSRFFASLPHIRMFC